MQVVLLETRDGKEKFVLVRNNVTRARLERHLRRSGKMDGNDKILAVKFTTHPGFTESFEAGDEHFQDLCRTVSDMATELTALEFGRVQAQAMAHALRLSRP